MAKKPRKSKVPTVTAVPIAPPMPPPSAEDIAREQKLLDDMRGLAERLQQRNLDNAVLLAHQAARGHGPLVAWFAEIGRRFGETLDAPPAPPTLRLIDGGAS